MKRKKFKREVHRFNHKENAVSPVVSTILLIMLVIIIAVIIILWFRVFLKESIIKEIAGKTKNIEDYCRDVRLKAILNDDNSFGVTNEGNVPIYGFNLKLARDDGTASEVPVSNARLNPGFSIMFSDQGYRNDYESVKAIPILLGKRKSSSATEQFICPDKYGVDI